MPLRPDLPYADDPEAQAAIELERLLRQRGTAMQRDAMQAPAPSLPPPPPPEAPLVQRRGIAPPPMDMEALISGEPTSRAIVDALRGREALGELGMAGGEWSRRAAAPVLAGARGRLGDIGRSGERALLTRQRITMEEQKRAAAERAAKEAAAAKEDYFQRGEAGKERRARIIAGEKVEAREEKMGTDLAKEAATYAKNVEPVIAGYKNYKTLYRTIEEDPKAAEEFMAAERRQAASEGIVGKGLQMILGAPKDFGTRVLAQIPAGPRRDAAARFYNARMLAAEYLGRKQSGGAITEDELQNFEQLVAGSAGAEDALRRIENLARVSTLGALEQGRPYRRAHGESFSVPEAYPEWEALAGGKNPLSGGRRAPSQGGIPRLPNEAAEADRIYRSLPSGAEFIDPGGKRRRKP